MTKIKQALRRAVVHSLFSGISKHTSMQQVLFLSLCSFNVDDLVSQHFHFAFLCNVIHQVRTLVFASTFTRKGVEFVWTQIKSLFTPLQFTDKSKQVIVIATNPIFTIKNYWCLQKKKKENIKVLTKEFNDIAYKSISPPVVDERTSRVNINATQASPNY